MIEVDVSRRVSAAMGAGLVLSGLILSGCTTTVAGSAEPAPRPAGEAEITAEPTPAPEIGDGTLVEAQRIAGATVLPEFVYPELTNSCFPTVPMIYPERMEGTIFIEGTAAAIYTTYGFVAGWSTCRNTLEGDRSAIVFVAEMSDRDSATVAARELADSFVELNGAEPTEIRGFENLPAVQTVSVEDGEDRIVYEVLQPVGRMLAYFYYSDSDLDAAQDDVGELLEEQRQLLGDFEPTPQDEIAELDPDRYDLARRTATPPVEPDLFTGSFDLAGYLHLAIDPQLEADLLPANGFVGLYNYSGSDGDTGASYQFQTYELGSLAEADAAFAEFTRIEQEEFSDRVMFTVPEDPTIPCFYIPATEAGGLVYQRCYSREGRLLGLTDVFAVTDPADITAVRGFVQEQIRLMAAP
ncbi:MAG: hypothetical protein H0X18_05380 [Geodermatophilaceae bacterium]|nr:hypothetical protein [Geodermatophilaceae bacterium]